MHLTHIFLLSHSVFVSDLFCKVFCCLIAYLCLTHSAICFVSLAICMWQHHFAHFLTVLLCVCICWPVFIHLSHSIQLLWQLPPLHLLISDSYVTISLLWHLRFFIFFIVYVTATDTTHIFIIIIILLCDSATDTTHFFFLLLLLLCDCYRVRCSRVT